MTHGDRANIICVLCWGQIQKHADISIPLSTHSTYDILKVSFSFLCVVRIYCLYAQCRFISKEPRRTFKNRSKLKAHKASKFVQPIDMYIMFKVWEDRRRGKGGNEQSRRQNIAYSTRFISIYSCSCARFLHYFNKNEMSMHIIADHLVGSFLPTPLTVVFHICTQCFLYTMFWNVCLYEVPLWTKRINIQNIPKPSSLYDLCI